MKNENRSSKVNDKQYPFCSFSKNERNLSHLYIDVIIFSLSNINPEASLVISRPKISTLINFASILKL
ncbi:hypothetical protein METBIDRAFT_29928 [Metschnikowia bicuspidata var. bicuspidata NRRL YB-4993]|uniref:Uncharacterized protein n=1 Tax=Metschnikowia bicuspidata var. bicuspidata NRRL YB-4993 TaxID=869754 RepID=A0A1A0HHI9_9ASCO|nr:hypothetical protein METBIDRAFT_29928 [Metschnikowia bicuspidata var. bicuspidata NRRL YB-4993]OBA23470.1 hypothetical protein METBIDRAFT_29928 [Metschnikowia bicuspidata var. bicuspidata NRRL YB-4993]